MHTHYECWKDTNLYVGMCVTELAEASYCHVEYSLSLDRLFIFNLDAI